MAETAAKMTKNESRYASGRYWQARMDKIYYQYVDFILRTVARDAKSLLDVGTGNCPYLEWFDWIPERASMDIRVPYQSEAVKGIKGNLVDMELGRKYDVCTCLQVLEHIPEAHRMALRLMQVSDLVVVSVPYKWRANGANGHVHDPVSENKLEDWFGRLPNYQIIVQEPITKGAKGRRLIAVYNKDESVRYGKDDIQARVPKSPRSF